MKKIKLLYFYLLIISLAGCTEDIDRNLGNGYFLTGYGVTTVIFKHYKGGGDDQILLGEIVDYSFDDRFILVYRKVSDKVINYFNDHPYSEIMRGGDSIQYWIIQKQIDSTLGPFHKEEYLLKRSKLKVPNSLQLKE